MKIIIVPDLNLRNWLTDLLTFKHKFEWAFVGLLLMQCRLVILSCLVLCICAAFIALTLLVGR